MAQAVDRWVSKVLALPIFSDRFAKALVGSPLANLALVSAMEVSSGQEFVLKVAEWATTMDTAVAQALLEEPAMLEQFWGVAASIEKMFFESTSVQLGFGICEPAQAHRVLSREESFRKQAAIKALLQKPQRDPKRQKTDPSVSATSTPLLDREQAERHKWAARLEDIGKRAGPFSKLFHQSGENDELTSSETTKLRYLVLSSGAHRTMRAHVGAWDRFELWALAKSVSVFPLSIEKVLKYALFLDDKECGPSVCDRHCAGSLHGSPSSAPTWMILSSSLCRKKWF